MTKYVRILIFLTVFSLILSLTSCKDDTSDDTVPGTISDTTAEETTADISEENNLSQALRLITEADNRSKSYTSFTENSSSATYYDDTLISKVNSTTKKSGDSYSFKQTTEAFDLYGNTSGDRTLELVFDGQSIVYYDTSASSNGKFGAIRINNAAKEEYLSMLTGANDSMLGFTDPEYFKNGSVTPNDGGYAVKLEYSDTAKAQIFGALGLTLSEGINAEVLEFTVLIDSEGNALNCTAETVISVNANGVSSRIRSVSSSEYANINSNPSVDETSTPNISLEFDSFIDYSTVAGMVNTLSLLASGSYTLEYEAKLELTSLFHQPYTDGPIFYTVDNHGAFNPTLGYSYRYSTSDGQNFKEYGDFKNCYIDTGDGIKGPVGYAYDSSSLVSLFGEIKPSFISLECIDSITDIEYSSTNIRISLDIDTKALLSYLDSHQIKFPEYLRIFEPQNNTDVEKKSFEILLSPEGLPLSLKVYFEGIAKNGYYSDSCDIAFSHTVTFTSFDNVNIEVLP